MHRIILLAVAIVTAVVAVAAMPGAIDVEAIRDKVRIKLGQELRVGFAADGDKLIQPKAVDGAGDGKDSVEIRLDVTDATPFRVRGVATRPFLVVSNGFERTLHFRVLARLKGGKEFFEVDWAGGDAEPGENATRCWESGSLVEELVLDRFALSSKPAK